jgi:hypothetical protein
VVLVLFRKGRIFTADVERQLDEVADEPSALRADGIYLHAQGDVTRAYEAHLSEATALLGRLREQLGVIDREGDWATKRQVVELLVSAIGVRTEGVGKAKRAQVTIRSTFQEQRHAPVSNTAASCCNPPASRPGS